MTKVTATVQRRIRRALRCVRWAMGLIFALTAVERAGADRTRRRSRSTSPAKIGKTNDAAHRSYRFAEAQLLALPARSITTSTTWTPRSSFTGPLLADILKTVGAYGTQDRDPHARRLHATRCPVSDCDRYGVVCGVQHQRPASKDQRLRAAVPHLSARCVPR